MSLNSFQRLSFLLVLLVLTVPALSDDWQASGNMTESNVTEINTAIKSHPITSATTAGQMDAVAQAISTHLNDIWAPAWNVAIVKAAQGSNSILYGYAFRNHWIWINGVVVDGMSQRLSYVIWKDFNCGTWTTVGNAIALGSNFLSDQDAILSTYYFDIKAYNDIWLSGFNFVEYLQGNIVFNGAGFSVVMSSDGNPTFSGYFCMFGYNSYMQKNVYYTGKGYAGSYFLFQTR